ncbi:MAG: AI-2E family transporter [Cyanobacteria bacterium P01_H01_bin.21]
MKPKSTSIIALLVSLASVVLIVAGLKAISGLLSPILLAFFLVLVTYPMLTWLQRKGLPNWLAYSSILLSVVLIGLFVLTFLYGSIEQLLSALPTYSDQIESQLTQGWQWLQSLGITSDDIESLSWFQPERLLQLSVAVTTLLLESVSKIGLTLLIFIYMLVTAPSFAKQLHISLGNNPLTLARFQGFARSTSTYLTIKSWLGALTALVQMLLMWILGLDFAVLWGALSFFFNFVPSVGLYIALIPPMLLAIVQLGWVKTLIFLVGYLGINNFFDIVVAPRYLAKGLDLSALVTFLAVIIWAWILGPIGAFIALPLTVMVKKLLLEAFPQTQIIATLISAGE